MPTHRFNGIPIKVTADNHERLEALRTFAHDRIEVALAEIAFLDNLEYPGVEIHNEIYISRVVKDDGNQPELWAGLPYYEGDHAND